MSITNSSNEIAIGKVETLSKQIDSTLTAVEIFQGLNQLEHSKNKLLLESSDLSIKKSNNTKSILMLQAAIRIECNDRQVVLSPLTENGKIALIHIIEKLGYEEDITFFRIPSSDNITVSYQKDDNIFDEDKKLKQLSPIDILRVINQAFEATSRNEFSLFLCGLFSYDLITSFENFTPIEEGFNTCPDFVFYLAESLLVIDHQTNNKKYFCNHFSSPFVSKEKFEKTYFELARSFEKIENQLAKIVSRNASIESKNKIRLNSLVHISNEVTVDISDSQYQENVIKLKKEIVSGNIFQVVPSRSFSLPCQSPVESYKILKKVNPSPYLFYLLDEKFELFGASPESALKYNKMQNMVELYPIAGTRPRGKRSNGEIDFDLDSRIEAELKQDTKEIAEHMMLIDLARNDIARISMAGSTYVPKLLEVDRYSQVMHLVSNVCGKLRPELDALHAYQACMNMGTLTGAPKIKATELLREIEGKRRGSYGGAIGYLNTFGDMDTCIVIRSAFVAKGVAHIQAGAGIVYDSDPLLEAQETSNKAKAVINAILAANSLSAQHRMVNSHE